MARNRLWSRVGAWLWTVFAVIVAIEFIIAAVQKLVGTTPALQPFYELGWPLWTASLTAIGEIIGSVALIIPATRIFGGLLLTTIMIGAAAANIANGHPEYLWLNLLLIAASLALAWHSMRRRHRPSKRLLHD